MAGGDTFVRLAIRFNLNTSDVSVTPKLFGYGVAITDS